MRFLTDENISPTIVVALEAAGFDVMSIAKDMPGCSDETGMELAVAQQRVIVTEDTDFGELVFKYGHRPAGLVRLVLPGFRPAQKASRLCEILASNANIVGHATVVEPHRTRKRPTPK